MIRCLSITLFQNHSARGLEKGELGTDGVGISHGHQRVLETAKLRDKGMFSCHLGLSQSETRYKQEWLTNNQNISHVFERRGEEKITRAGK